MTRYTKRIKGDLIFGVSMFGRSILCLSCLLVLLGFFWRSPLKIDGTMSSFAVVAASFAVVGFLILVRLGDKKFDETGATSKSTKTFSASKIIRRHGILLPALSLGFLMPFFSFLAYTVLLLLAEYLYWKRRDGAKPMPEIFCNDPRSCLDVEGNNIETDFESLETEDEFDENMTQQIVRNRTEKGRDRLEGTFLVEFANDQLTATLHIPFCPAFNALPELETYLLDEADAKIVVGNVQLFGIRIEIRRANTASPRLRLMLVAEEPSL